MDIQKLIDFVKSTGSHFFDRETMRFFKSRVLDKVFDGGNVWYFVTSERGPLETSKRKYTVRQVDKVSGNVETVGEFREYSTSRQAFNRIGELNVRRHYFAYFIDQQGRQRYYFWAKDQNHALEVAKEYANDSGITLESGPYQEYQVLNERG